MPTARVLDTDNGRPKTLIDQYGEVWTNVIDNTDADGTFAVESDDGRCGVARLQDDGTVTVYSLVDGDTYGYADEYVARRHQWVVNDDDPYSGNESV